jgi:hypothetical protein
MDLITVEVEGNNMHIIDFSEGFSANQENPDYISDSDSESDSEYDNDECITDI